MSRPRLIALLLALVTLLAYLPVTHYDFVTYDDTDYVLENSVVQKGLTLDGIQWAFTTGHTANWHPITWLSHMVDCELFGLNPGAFHFVNALFHAANTALLFLLLLRLTNSLWPGATVAALFAWHPLHVESVAWIAERKDVLSTFFALLALLSYSRYAQTQARVEGRKPKGGMAVSALVTRHSSTDYFLALFFFALGLMSKPMVVTLPFVMLLLDYWPIQRFNNSTIQRLLAEKIPFFVLAAISCVVTFLVQRHGEALLTLEQFPLNLRLENSVISYGRYLLKMVWPADLAVIYPVPTHLHWIQAVATLVALIVICRLVWLARRACPYLLVGWLWFLGTLVPVIGIVKVGNAALADRYTYFPLIGIFIAVVFGIRDLADRFQIPKMIPAGATVLILAACLALTENQLRYWRDGETLFIHALAVTKDNQVAHLNLGVALEQKGETNAALAQYRAAEQLAPGLCIIHNNLANLLDNLGHREQALVEYREAIRLNPGLPVLHTANGLVLTELGRFDEALAEFTNTMRLDSFSPVPHVRMGDVLLKQGRDVEAIGQFREALRLAPDDFTILARTAHVLASIENPGVRDGKNALVLATKANALTGGQQPFVLDILGMADADAGDFTDAVEKTQKALDLADTAGLKNTAMRQRLQLYKNRRPWRESFLATNAPVKN